VCNAQFERAKHNWRRERKQSKTQSGPLWRPWFYGPAGGGRELRRGALRATQPAEETEASKLVVMFRAKRLGVNDFAEALVWPRTRHLP
jgi:hypothetical protein